MKKAIFTLSLLAFGIFVDAQVTDTVSLDWEILPGVPVRTFAFAQSGERTFAINGRLGSDASLYFSENNGEDWVKHPAFGGNVDHVMANDSLTFVFTHRLTLLNMGYTAIFDYYVHRSTDGGMVFDTVFRRTYTIVQPSSSGYGDIRGQFLSGNYCTMGIKTIGSLNSVNWKNFYSTDGGISWEEGESNLQFSSFADGKWRGANVGKACESNTPDFAASNCHFTGNTGTSGQVLVGADWRDGAWYLLSNIGLFYSSADNGSTWAEQDLTTDFGKPTGFRFYNGHYFITAEKGMYRSAGDTPTDWEPVFQNPFSHYPYCTSFAAFGDVYFLDAYGPGVVRSLDSGQNWSVKYEGLGSQPAERVFRAGNEVWAGRYIDLETSIGPVLSLYTLQADLTWLPLSGNGLSESPMTSFVFEAEDHIWAQQDHSGYSLFRTSDGGENWQAVVLPTTFNWYLRGANKDLENRLWFWTDNMAAFTTDLGQTWTEVSFSGSEYGANLVAHGNTLVRGGKNKLYRSTDLGQNWLETPLPATSNYYQLFQIAADSLVYFNGDNGQAWHSADFGSTWVQVGDGFDYTPPNSYPFFWWKHRSSILALSLGGLFITNDFGLTWTWINNPPGMGYPIVLNNHIYFSNFSYSGTWRADAEGLVAPEIMILNDETLINERLDATIFPNPTSGDFIFEMDLPQPMGISIEAMDMLGRQVAVISENEFFQKGKQRVSVDASTWPPGIYLLHLQTDGHSFSKKIIKQ